MSSLVQLIKTLPSDDQYRVLKEHMNHLYKNDLFKFARDCLDYPDINETTHQEMIDVLQSDSKRKLIVMPRGSLKSTLATVAYPIWLLINNPNLRILIDSEVYTNSATYLREIKGQLMKSKLNIYFGEFYNDTNWNESEITIKQRQLLKKEASITAGGVGTVKVGQHYDIIIGDDYNSDKALTPESLEKVIRHYQMNNSILEQLGTYVIIGTRYAERDLIGFVLKNEIEMEAPNESQQRIDSREISTTQGLLSENIR